MKKRSWVSEPMRRRQEDLMDSVARCFRRAEAEFLSLAPTPWHLGQFLPELKDGGTVGTRWGSGGSVSQSE